MSQPPVDPKVVQQVLQIVCGAGSQASRHPDELAAASVLVRERGLVPARATRLMEYVRQTPYWAGQVTSCLALQKCWDRLLPQAEARSRTVREWRNYDEPTPVAGPPATIEEIGAPRGEVADGDPVATVHNQWLSRLREAEARGVAPRGGVRMRHLARGGGG